VENFFVQTAAVRFMQARRPRKSDAKFCEAKPSISESRSPMLDQSITKQR